MRQFRGLRIDGGGWAHGGFYSREFAMGSIAVIIDDEGHHHPVSWASIGQSIGKKDHYGAKIFEGDRVRLKADSFSEELGKATGEWITECIYQSACYIFRCMDNPHLSWRYADKDFNGLPFIKQVIGNIHEK